MASSISQSGSSCDWAPCIIFMSSSLIWLLWLGTHWEGTGMAEKVTNWLPQIEPFFPLEVTFPWATQIISIIGPESSQVVVHIPVTWEVLRPLLVVYDSWAKSDVALVIPRCHIRLATLCWALLVCRLFPIYIQKEQKYLCSLRKVLSCTSSSDILVIHFLN